MQDVKDRMKGRIEGAADTAKEGVDRAASTMHQFGQQASGAVSSAIDKAKEYGSTAVEGINKAKDTVKDYASSAYDITSETVGNAAKDAKMLVRRYPISSVLTGLALGLAFGCLFGCALSKRS